jgi:hypothetical protein
MRGISKGSQRAEAVANSIRRNRLMRKRLRRLWSRKRMKGMSSIVGGELVNGGRNSKRETRRLAKGI